MRTLTDKPDLMTSDEVERIIIEVLREFDSVVLVYLFGSFGRRKPHAFSDIDVAVYFQKYSFEEFMKVYGAVSRALRADVDLVPLNIAPPLLRYEILRHGRRLVSKDEKTRILFESRAIVDGLDEKPLLDAIRRANLERVLA